MGCELKKSEIWRGKYKGVGFEICKWQTIDYLRNNEKKDVWSFYLFIVIKSIPTERQGQFWLEGKKSEGHDWVSYDYYGHTVGEIEFHCGCTYYEKASGFDNADKIIKVGCDYNHYWDEGHVYNLEDVHKEVEDAIDSLYELVPNMKCRCGGNGNYYLPEEGEFTADGGFRSNGWVAERAKKTEVPHD